MSVPTKVHQWLRYGNGAIPLRTRAFRRYLERRRAVSEFGSVSAFLEHLRDNPAEPIGADARDSGDEPQPQFVHLSTYPVHEAATGGQIRTLEIARGLARQFPDENHEIRSVATTAAGAGTYRLAPNLIETCTQLSDEYLEVEARVRLVTGDIAITDVVLSMLWTRVPALSIDLKSKLPSARLIVAAQPYLVGVHQALASNVPLVYDAHNDEATLKTDIFPTNEAGRWLVDQTRVIEDLACTSASLVTTTTHDDLADLNLRHSMESTLVVPNGVDTELIPFTTAGERSSKGAQLRKRVGAPEGRPTALFVGSAHGPNIEAAKRIVSAAHKLSNVDFVLVGAHSDHLNSHLPDNVFALGAVDEPTFELALAGADLALNPMIHGGGSNLKVLSYLAAGLPVISTEVGVRGIDHHSAAIHLTEIHNLEKAIGDLSSNLEEADVESARRYVESERDWRRLSAKFAQRVAEEFNL